jgi:hypothetical protein
MDDARTARLARLSKLRQDSASENQAQVAKEFQDFKAGQAAKGAAKEERLRAAAKELLAEKEAAETGRDYERLKNLDYSVDDVDRWTAKVEAKMALADEGFTGAFLVSPMSLYCPCFMYWQCLTFSLLAMLLAQFSNTLPKQTIFKLLPRLIAGK